MKKITLILILLMALSSTVFGHSKKKLPYEKYFSVHAGLEVNFIMWHVGGGSVGPKVGASWERWRTPKRGFSVGIDGLYSSGFPGGLTLNAGEREIKSYSYFAVPIMWGFRNNKQTFAFRIGLQPKVSVIAPYGEHHFNSGRIITTETIAELNLPMSFTCFITKNFSLDFNITLPGFIFPFYTPINPSIGVNATWRFLKNKPNPIILLL